jgi:hypothetical protein
MNDGEVRSIALSGGRFMLEIIAVTDNDRSNPPNPTSIDRLLLNSGNRLSTQCSRSIRRRNYGFN